MTIPKYTQAELKRYMGVLSRARTHGAHPGYENAPSEDQVVEAMKIAFNLAKVVNGLGAETLGEISRLSGDKSVRSDMANVLNDTREGAFTLEDVKYGAKIINLYATLSHLKSKLHASNKFELPRVRESKKLERLLEPMGEDLQNVRA